MPWTIRHLTSRQVIMEKLEIRNRTIDKIEDSENMKGRYERTLKHITLLVKRVQY